VVWCKVVTVAGGTREVPRGHPDSAIVEDNESFGPGGRSVSRRDIGDSNVYRRLVCDGNVYRRPTGDLSVSRRDIGDNPAFRAICDNSVPRRTVFGNTVLKRPDCDICGHKVSRRPDFCG
jgi:hypothetical protein